jgi:D-amino-acid dehydrogenase
VGERAVVVGAGAIGVACAHYLSLEGFEVTLVDRGEVGRGCSFANAGLIVPGHSQALPAPGAVREGMRHLLRRGGPFAIRPRPDAELAKWLLAFRRSCTTERWRRTTRVLTDLSRMSHELFEELVDSGSTRFGYERGPLINAYLSEDWEDRAEAFARQLEVLGFSSKVLDRHELAELEPALGDPVRGALVVEDQGSGDCFAYVRSLAEALPARGVRVLERTPVHRVTVRRARAIGVFTPEPVGEIEADLVVLAAGAWTPALTASLGLRLPIQPATGYSATFRAWPGMPRRPVMLDEAHVVLLPLGDRLRFAGTLELAGFRKAPDPIRYRAVVRAGNAALREPPPTDGRAWFGFRPLTPDDLPAIGWVPNVRSVIVAAGHGTLGFTQSPATGKLVAELAAGKPSSLPMEPFRPDRF